MTNDKRRRRRSRGVVPWVVWMLLSGISSAAAQTPPPRVSFELLTEAGFSSADSHQWMAFLKALGDARPGEFGWRDVEVARESSGRPAIVLHGPAREAADRRQVRKIHVSLSHTRELAAACAAVEWGTGPAQPAEGGG